MTRTDSAPLWFAVWTRSRHEDLVRSQLVQKSLEVFLPKVQAWSSRKDRRKLIEKPLFPGYLFVRTLLNRQTHLEIVKCRGVVKVLGFEKDEATPVPDEEIESVKLLLASGAEVAVHLYIRVGELVKVVSGPFRGAVGRVAQVRGHRRLVVSLEILDKSVSVVLEEEKVVPYQSVITPPSVE